MRRKAYFFVIGIIELIIFGLIFGYCLIVILGLSFDAQWALRIAKMTDGSYNYYDHKTTFAPLLTSDKFALWVAFFVFSLFGPAFGLVLITVSNLMEDNNIDISTFSYSGARIEREIEELQKQIDSLNQQLKQGPDLVFQEETIVEEGNVKPISNDNNQVVEKKDKNSYQLGERIQLNCDFEFEGTIIKKGSTGVIDNWLLSSLGKTYVVILDDDKKEIHIRGEYFE